MADEEGYAKKHEDDAKKAAAAGLTEKAEREFREAGRLRETAGTELAGAGKHQRAGEQFRQASTDFEECAKLNIAGLEWAEAETQLAAVLRTVRAASTEFNVSGDKTEKDKLDKKVNDLLKKYGPSGTVHALPKLT